ncbi:MAG TPA: hypothetical protein VMA37_10720 [Acetobacteraceae bacterium]|nr:hypothetical protein [Acetobacteraceae bacterium]
MPIFTIEATYRIPVYRQRSYEAGTLAEACRLAIEDDDWAGQKEDYESAGETYVTGAWAGDVQPYSVPALPVRSHFGENLQRKAEHFEVLLGLLKIFAHAPEGDAADDLAWRKRADAAIARAEAILAGARDAEGDGGAS